MNPLWGCCCNFKCPEWQACLDEDGYKLSFEITETKITYGTGGTVSHVETLTYTAVDIIMVIVDGKLCNAVNEAQTGTFTVTYDLKTWDWCVANYMQECGRAASPGVLACPACDCDADHLQNNCNSTAARVQTSHIYWSDPVPLGDLTICMGCCDPCNPEEDPPPYPLLCINIESVATVTVHERYYNCLDASQCGIYPDSDYDASFPMYMKLYKPLTCLAPQFGATSGPVPLPPQWIATFRSPKNDIDTWLGHMLGPFVPEPALGEYGNLNCEYTPSKGYHANPNWKTKCWALEDTHQTDLTGSPSKRLYITPAATPPWCPSSLPGDPKPCACGWTDCPQAIPPGSDMYSHWDQCFTMSLEAL